MFRIPTSFLCLAFIVSLAAAPAVLRAESMPVMTPVQPAPATTSDVGATQPRGGITLQIASDLPTIPSPTESLLIVLAAAAGGGLVFWVVRLAGRLRPVRGDAPWTRTRA